MQGTGPYIQMQMDIYPFADSAPSTDSSCKRRGLANRGDEWHGGEQELGEAAPDVPARLLAEAVIGVVVVSVREVAGEEDRFGLIGLRAAELR